MSNTPIQSNAKGRTKWKPSASVEARRLELGSEKDWNLAAAVQDLPRTRRQRRLQTDDDDDLSREEETVVASQVAVPVGGEDGLSSMTEDPNKSPNDKPSHSRAVIEIGPVSEMLSKHLVCLKCQHPLSVTFPTTGIATSCKLTCTDEVKCDYVALSAPALAEVPLDEDAGSALIARTTDFALNVTYVLSFIACGDGGAEAERVLGMNGLPNSTTMQSAFSKTEQRISASMQEHTDEIVLNNLREEVQLTFGNATDDNNDNALYDLWLQDKLPQQQWPRIGGSADMGWQQKGSG